MFTDGLLKDHKLVVHIVTEDNVAAKILRDTRDLCNSEVSQLLNCEIVGAMAISNQDLMSRSGPSMTTKRRKCQPIKIRMDSSKIIKWGRENRANC